MKIKIVGHEKLIGPNGERFAEDAEYRLATKGEHYLSDDGKAVYWNEHRNTVSFFIILTLATPPTPKVTRWPVVVNNYGKLVAGELSLTEWVNCEEFRGFVYTTKDGEQINCEPAMWMCGHGALWCCPDAQATRIVRPSFVEVSCE